MVEEKYDMIYYEPSITNKAIRVKAETYKDIAFKRAGLL